MLPIVQVAPTSPGRSFDAIIAVARRDIAPARPEIGTIGLLHAKPVSPVIPPLLLRPTEAADYLSISRSKLYELLDVPGGIPSVFIDRCRRIRVDDLRGYVDRLSAERTP